MAAKQIKTHTHTRMHTNLTKHFDLSRRMTDGKSVGWIGWMDGWMDGRMCVWIDGSAKKLANE